MKKEKASVLCLFFVGFVDKGKLFPHEGHLVAALAVNGNIEVDHRKLQVREIVVANGRGRLTKEFYARHLVAVVKSETADVCHVATYDDTFEPGTSRKTALADTRHLVADDYRLQRPAAAHKGTSDAGDTVGNDNGTQTGAVFKCRTADARQRIGKDEIVEPQASLESGTADGFQRGGKADSGDFGTRLKGTVPDALQ